MARNDKATLVISSGEFYIAPAGTDFPADLKTLGPDWAEIGHTDAETPLEFERDGGDKNVLPTLQARQHRTSLEPIKWTIKLKALQWDKDTLKLNFGGNSVDVDGRVGVVDAPAPTEKAFLGLLRDAGRTLPIYAKRTEIIGSGEIDFGDAESLASMELDVTPLKHETHPAVFEIAPVIS